MQQRDIIVIGASAGGLDPALEILSKLPAEFPVAIFLVIHVAPSVPSLLPAILSRRARFPALHPSHGDPIKPGQIYIAPPDYHMILSQNHILLDHGPRENRHRPSVDPLFRSAAIQFGPRVIGLILSGALDDGTAGLQAIKSCGGVAIVQHPEDAQWPSMPENALRSVEVDHCVPAAKIAALLEELVGGNVPAHKPNVNCGQPVKEETARHGLNLDEMRGQFGAPSGLICPECNGPLWEVRHGKHIHFRCLVGHHFSPESFLEEETEALERALWVAVKTLEERSVVLNRLSERSGQQDKKTSADQFKVRARESEEHAEAIRKILQRLRS